MAKNQTKPDMQAYILLMEKDPELRKIMRISLEQVGHKVVTEHKFANVTQTLQKEPPEVFVVDFDLRQGDPGRLMATYRQHMKGNRGAVIVLTSERLEDDWRQKHQPDSVIYKPFDIRFFLRLIKAIGQQDRVLV